jgi:hypothetical protein
MFATGEFVHRCVSDIHSRVPLASFDVTGRMNGGDLMGKSVASHDQPSVTTSGVIPKFIM